MRRVAQQLDLVLVGGTLQVLGGGRIDEDKNPARSEDAGHLAHCEGNVVEVMCGEPCGNDVEARFGKGELLRARPNELRVPQASCLK